MAATDQGEDYDPRAAITKLSANLEQPDKFAEIFCAAAKKQKDIDNILKENIRDIIKNDSPSRAQLKGLLREIEQEDLKFFLKKGGSALVVFLSILAGALINASVAHFFK